MEPLPPLPTVEPGRYRHYKGHEYEVLGVVRHSESLEPMVLYRPLHGTGGGWVRPHAMFGETVELDGRRVPRFARIADAEAAATPAADPVGEPDLAATVERMEARLLAGGHPALAPAVGWYRRCAVRFERDLGGCRRDLLLAKASALMLLQAAAAGDGSDDGESAEGAEGADRAYRADGGEGGKAVDASKPPELAPDTGRPDAAPRY